MPLAKDIDRPLEDVLLDAVLKTVHVYMRLAGDFFKLENAITRGIDEAGMGQFYCDIHK